jgi:hypothetical protein
MKQTEIDFQSLSRKEYHDKFCKEFSLDVFRRAYAYSKNGHMPQNAIPTAAVIYAEPFKLRPLRVHGVWAEKKLNAVTVWDLQTETESAQRFLLKGKWDYPNRAMCVARLGENYACTKLQTLEFPDELIIGVYQHYHRFAAIVSIDNSCVSAISVPKVTAIANLMGKNAVAYYPEYLHQKEQLDYQRKHAKKGKVLTKLPEFREFLLAQPVQFVAGVNQRSIFGPKAPEVSIAAYLEDCSAQLEQKLTIASVDMFGEF